MPRRVIFGQIFRRTVDGRTLTFSSVEDGNGETIAQDAETGSQWDISGRAKSGALQGKRLDSPAHYNQLFWFSWAAFNHETRIHTGTESDATENAVAI